MILIILLNIINFFYWLNIRKWIIRLKNKTMTIIRKIIIRFNFFFTILAKAYGIIKFTSSLFVYFILKTIEFYILGIFFPITKTTMLRLLFLILLKSGLLRIIIIWIFNNIKILLAVFYIFIKDILWLFILIIWIILNWEWKKKILRIIKKIIRDFFLIILY